MIKLSTAVIWVLVFITINSFFYYTKALNIDRVKKEVNLGIDEKIEKINFNINEKIEKELILMRNSQNIKLDEYNAKRNSLEHKLNIHFHDRFKGQRVRFD
ncbi:MAG TPA: hypothetical protein ENH85_09765 [Candidatus Scalindua sp.]|nr:hypothetical protein [Candidatus Scalindua sp.]